MSDLHLGAQSPEKERSKRDRFRALVGDLERGDRLFLLGDVFDVWIGWSEVVSSDHIQALGALRDAVDRGIPVVFLAGNHDFQPGRVLQEEVGADVHMDGLSIRVPGYESIHLSHGDEPESAGPGYGVLRRLLRSSPAGVLLRTLPPAFVLGVFRWASETSRHHSDDTQGVRWLDRYQKRVAKPLWSRGHRVVICGHHHVGAVRVTNDGVLVNLGHWFDEPTYAIREGASIRLLRDSPTGTETLGQLDLRPSKGD